MSDQVRRDIAQFGNQLIDKFAHVSKSLAANTKANLLAAKFEGELARRMQELSHKENFDELLINRARKINSS